MQFSWLGWDADKVGHHTTDGQPDGRFDQHFRLSLALKSPQEVFSIALYHADDQGIPTQSHHWSSQDSASSVLGVEVDGRRLNPSHMPSLGRFSGNVGFDLFASDDGWEKGSFALVEVGLANGRKLGHWFRLEPPASRLMGKWNILCFDVPPEVFEPQTLSGRFYMALEPDGRITGLFGGQRLSGSIDKSGAASGMAGAGEEAITWSGTISKPARNKPLKGKGSFEFQQAGRECSGGQWWSD